MDRFGRMAALVTLLLGVLHLGAQEASACGRISCAAYFQMGFSGNFSPMMVPQQNPSPLPPPIPRPMPQAVPQATHGGFVGGGFVAPRPVGVTRINVRVRTRQLGCPGFGCGSSVRVRASVRVRGGGCFGRSFRRCC